MKLKFANALSLALIMAMLFTSVGLADNVQNDVVAAGNGTMTAGSSTVVNYRISANNGDGQTGCNAADATPATVTINTPTGVTVDTSGTPGNQVTLTFTACNAFLPATFSSSNAGDYLITVSVADGGTGTYNTNPASFTLHVLAPIGTVAVKLAGGPSSGVLSWTRFDGNTCSGPGNSSSNDTVNSVAFTSLAGVGGGQSIRMTAPTIAGYTFSGWSGAISSTSNPVCVVGSSSNQQVTANYTVSAQATTLTVASASATYGDASVTLSATVSPDPGAGSVSFSVNGSSAGSGTVGAGGVATVSFNPSALSAGPHTIQASFGGSGTFLASSGSGTLSISQASSTTTVTCGAGPFTYTGSAQTPCSASVTGVGGLSQILTVNYSDNTNAGPATASASFAGDTNHTGSSDTENFTIGQASSNTIVTCDPGPFTYSGSAFTPCSASYTTSDGLSGALTVVYSDNTNAGTATASATYAGDANHAGSSDTENFAIGQASSTTTVTCNTGPFTYNGSAFTPCSASYTTSDGLSGALTVGYSDNTNAGTATASATYAGDANHAGSSDTETFIIDPAPSVTIVTCPINVTYTGLVLEPCTGSVTGAGGLNQSLTVSYADNINAGTATASASYSGDANHTGSSGSENFTIDPAPSVTTVTCPTNVIYTGAALEPCSASVTGAGGLNQAVAVNYADNINAGPATASASFAGDANHTGSSDTETFTIDPAPSVVTVTCLTSVTYTGAAQTPCTAKASGAGMSDVDVSASLVYANNTNAGNAIAQASWAGDANHTGSTGSGGFTIDRANATCTVTGYDVLFDNAYHTATGSCTGVLGETLSGLDLSGTTHKLVGTYNDTWTFTDVTGNYNNTSGTVTDKIGAWTLRGFYQPVDMGGVYNTVRNGSTVPLKFEIFAGSTELTDIAAVQQPLVVNVVTCQTGAVEDLIETVATGGTSLRYDTSGGQFIFNWKTPSTAGRCYRVTMTALDGSSLVAFFKLK